MDTLVCDAPPVHEPASQRCERCNFRQAYFHVAVLDELVRSCCECLTPHERREIDEARREAEYARLHPRDVVETEGANL